MPLFKDTPFLKSARARFKAGDEADAAQRKREQEDLSFHAGNQWPADILASRKGQQPINGLPAVPARPTLVINKVREPVRQILNQERSSDIGIELVPADDFGDLGVTPDETEITLREGLVRRIQRESIAADARSWAYARAVEAGRGFYRINTAFLPGRTWDQEIRIERIYNQAAVVLDPSHTMPDGSDAEWGFIGTDLSWERYKSDFPKTADGKPNKLTEASDSEFRALGDDVPTWFKTTGDGKEQKRSVRVTEYFYKEHTARSLVMLSDGSSAWKDELPKRAPRSKAGKFQSTDGYELPEGVEIEDERSVNETVVKWAKIDGCQVLERTDWPGSCIPIVKVLGDELQPFDSDRRVEGMVRPSRDAQMGYNYMVSKEVEVIGLTPIPPLQLDPKAIAGYEGWYQVMNTRALPYGPYRSYDDEGRPLNPPVRPPVDPNILPIAQAIQLFDAGIKSTTAVPDPTLGNVDPTLKSGRAIKEVVANAQLSTSNYLDNLVRSMRYEGEILNDLLYPIYGARPGRLVRIMTGEGEAQMVRVDTVDQVSTGQRQPASMGALGGSMGPAGMGAGGGVPPATAGPPPHVLTKDAHFNVIVKVSKNFDSRRDQERTVIGELLGQNPELLTWFGDLFFKNQDGPGHVEMSERAKVMLAPPIQNYLAQKSEGKQPIPPEVQAKLAAADQQLQQAQEIITELSEKAKGHQIAADAKIAGDRIGADKDLQIAALNGQRDVDVQKGKTQLERAKLTLEAMKLRADVLKARAANATTIHVAEINAKTKGVIQAQEAEHEAIALSHTQEHEAEQKQLDRENLDRQQQQSQAHEAELAERAAQQQSKNGGGE